MQSGLERLLVETGYQGWLSKSEGRCPEIYARLQLLQTLVQGSEDSAMKRVACLVACLILQVAVGIGSSNFLGSQKDHALMAEPEPIEEAVPNKPTKPLFGPEARNIDLAILQWDNSGTKQSAFAVC